MCSFFRDTNKRRNLTVPGSARNGIAANQTFGERSSFPLFPNTSLALWLCHGACISASFSALSLPLAPDKPLPSLSMK